MMRVRLIVRLSSNFDLTGIRAYQFCFSLDFINGLCRFWNSEWIVERSGISTRRLHVFRNIVRAWMDATVATQDNLLDSIKLTADDLANAIIQGLQNQNQNEAIASITALNKHIQGYAPTSGPEHEGAKDIFRGHLPRLDNH